jgi:pre-mRNA-splicing factor ATP-dependent RNA helicase DHX16
LEEAANRLKVEAADKMTVVPTLRVKSRRDYLAKRKEDKISELEADIRDDENLFNEDE